MRLFQSNYFMGLDISKVDKVYYTYACDKAVFFHPDLVDSYGIIDFPIKNCDVFVMNLKAILVYPGDKILHHFKHFNRFKTSDIVIDDISGAYSTYFLSKKHDQALILSSQCDTVNISWHDDNNMFVTTIDNGTGETKTVAID
ncbi:MAG: hypothetical protein RXO36_07240 [Candidatus Nanopusillus acidilobi]